MKDIKCDVCHLPVEENKGSIYVIMSPRCIEELVEDEDYTELLCGEHADFVNSVTNQYFSQLPEVFMEKANNGVVDLTKRLKVMKDHKYRLSSVLKSKTEKDVYLIAHDNCVPEGEAAIYNIELSKLRTPQEGIGWTIHMTEKEAFNPAGWGMLLATLYEIEQ